MTFEHNGRSFKGPTTQRRGKWGLCLKLDKQRKEEILNQQASLVSDSKDG